MKSLRPTSLQVMFQALRRARQFLVERLRTFLVLVGQNPGLSRHHDLDAWAVLAEHRSVRRRPKPATGTGRKIVPLRASVDDPHVRLRITM